MGSLNGFQGRSILALALLLGVSQAQAVPILRLSTGTESVEIADASALDTAALDGVVVYAGSLLGWSFTISTGLSKPFVGSDTKPVMDLNSIVVSSLRPGTLTIELTDTGFLGSGDARSNAAIGGTTFGTVSYQTYFDAGNAAFARTDLLNDLGTAGPVAFSGTGSARFAVAGPYSLTSVVTINHTAAGQLTSFDALVRVPEPTSLLLLGTGLLGIGASLRRRRSLQRGGRPAI